METTTQTQRCWFLQADGKISERVNGTTDIVVQGGRSPPCKSGRTGDKLDAARRLLTTGQDREHR